MLVRVHACLLSQAESTKAGIVSERLPCCAAAALLAALCVCMFVDDTGCYGGTGIAMVFLCSTYAGAPMRYCAVGHV